MSDKSRRLQQFVDAFIEQFERLEKFLAGDLTNIKAKSIELRLNDLNTNWTYYKKCLPPNDKLDTDVFTADICEKIEELYYDIRPQLEEHIAQKIKKATKPIATPTVINSKLPDISLDEFNGDFLNWTSFIGTFNSLVHNNGSLSILSKFQYLKRSLKGPAALAIESLDFSEENYDVARELLKERFDKPSIICEHHIKSLFMFKPIDKSCPRRLIELVDHFKSHLRSSSSLGRPVDQWGDLVLYLITSKLDPETKTRGIDETPTARLPTVEDIYTFLYNRSLKLETQSKSVVSATSNHKLNSKPVARPFKAATSLPVSKSVYRCNYCNKKGHTIVRCQKFLTLLCDERQKFISHSKFCFNCLHSDHLSSNCPSSDRCRHCKKAHHSLLHPGNSEYSILSASSSLPVPSTSTSHVSSSLTPTECKPPTMSFVYLATALIYVRDRNNKYVMARALLDSGSQVNFISESFATKLMIRREKSKIEIQGVGSKHILSHSAMSITIKSVVNNFITALDVQIISNITAYQPPSCINNIVDWNIPSNIKLADTQFYKPLKIDLLIGADLYHELLSIGQIKINDNLPILQNTVLGWIVCGKLNLKSDSNSASSHVVSKQADDLHDQIEKFWTVENLPHSVKELTLNEIECEQHFKRFTIRDKDGRFIVKIPFCNDPSASLGNSFHMAHSRFQNLERRLQNTPEVMELYSEFMNDYIKLGHMTEAPGDISHPNYFLPHHCVLKPTSSTTKLRVVFDASARTSSGQSLNSIMRVGPTIQNELFAILLRFRTHKIAFSADISKMYRQIRINDEHKQFQMILWRNQPSEELKKYYLQTVTYGTASASYLATRCIVQLAQDNQSTLSTAASAILSDFYVDDLLTGADTVENAIKLKSEIECILKSGCFELKKWCSNCPEVLRDVPADDREPFLIIDNDEVIKTLGVYWHPSSDKFIFTANMSPSAVVTKRSIFSSIARIYDPLGLISPVVMIGKLLIQSLWQVKLHWDESIPQQYFTRRLEFQNDLLSLNKFILDRRAFQTLDNSSYEIHGFSDASEKGYGAVLYVRAVSSDGEVSVQLLCSKSRVAPLKSITLPRLELCGAVLLADLCVKCLEILQIDTPDIIRLWCDSTIALHWIKGDASRWKTFVANRVNHIQKITSSHQWYHVSSLNNPADLISRGAKASELRNSKLWLHGPQFLCSSKSEWPESKFTSDESIIDEVKNQSRAVCLVSSNKDETDDIILNIKYSNDYQSVLRVICYVLRFKKNHIRGPLQPCEINVAKLTVAKVLQKQSFPEVYAGLSKSNYIVNDARLKALSLFRDEHNVIRVGGRLQYSTLAYNIKHPILLPSSHSFTITIIRSIHRQLHHVGPLALLSAVRAEYWPINGRALCTKVYRECVTCFRAKPKSFHQKLGNLPMDRVTIALPFHTLGVDFCGPVFIHHRIRGKQPTKTYICIYECFTSKATHIEVATDLSTDAFMGTLKRMIATRGLPRKIVSDNGTNFVGANSKLHELYQMLSSPESTTAIQDYCLANQIEWKFLPPYSPNFGGLHEASVKLFKYHLRRSMGCLKPTYEQLLTLAKEIEAILNSRPLTPLSSSPDDFRCLTPGDILIGRPLIALPSPVLGERPPLDTWKHLEFIRCNFWKRWSEDYLRAQ